MDWQKLSQQIKKVGYRTLVIKTFRLPDGSTQEFTTYAAPNLQEVAIIALTSDKKVVIARQYRPGPEMIMDELPGGDAEPGEDYAQAARRELREETGYEVGSIELLGTAYRDAYKNATTHYFIGYDCHKAGDQALEPTEFVAIVLLSIDELLTTAKQGRLTDAGALFLGYDKLLAAK